MVLLRETPRRAAVSRRPLVTQQHPLAGESSSSSGVTSSSTRPCQNVHQPSGGKLLLLRCVVALIVAAATNSSPAAAEPPPADVTFKYVDPLMLSQVLLIFVLGFIALVGLCCLVNVNVPVSYSERPLSINKEY